MAAQLDDLTLRLKAEGFENAMTAVNNLTLAVQALKTEMGQATTKFTALNTAAKGTAGKLTQTATAARKVAKDTKVATTEVDKAKVGFLGLNDTLDKTIRKVLLWSISTGVIFGTARAFKALFSVVTQHDLQMTSLRKVYSGAESDIRRIKIQVMETAKAMQSLTADALKAGIIVARTGRQGAEIAELTRTALIAQNIAEIDAADSVRFLNAAVIQFNENVSESIRILDEWNELSNRTPATTKDMAQAASFAGSVFETLGADIQFLNAMTATLVEVTAKSGNMIGRAERTMAVYSQRISTVNKLSAIGINVYDRVSGAYRGLDTILTEVAVSWDRLTDVQKASTAQAIAGTRQQQFFIALMKNQDLLFDNLIIQWESFGSATRENDLFLQSINKKVDALKNSLESLAISLGDAGLAGAIKHELDLFTNMLKALNTTEGAALTLGSVVLGLTATFVASFKAGGKFASVMFFVGKAFAWVAVAQVAIEILGFVARKFNEAAHAADTLSRENEKVNESFNLALANADRIDNMVQSLENLANAREVLTRTGADTEKVDRRIVRVLQAIGEHYPELNTEMKELIKSQDTWNVSLQETARRLEELKTAKLEAELESLRDRLSDLAEQAFVGLGQPTTTFRSMGKGGAIVKFTKQPLSDETRLSIEEAILGVKTQIAATENELTELEEGTANISNEALQTENDKLDVLKEQLKIYQDMLTGATDVEVAELRLRMAKAAVRKETAGTVAHAKALINVVKEELGLQKAIGAETKDATKIADKRDALEFELDALERLVAGQTELAAAIQERDRLTAAVGESEEDNNETLKLQVDLQRAILKVMQLQEKAGEAKAAEDKRELNRNMRRAEQFARPFGQAISDAISSGFEAESVNAAMNRFVSQLGDNLSREVGRSVSASLFELSGNTIGSAIGGSLVGGLVGGIVGLIGNLLFPTDDETKREQEVEDNTKALRELNDSISDLTQLFINAPTGFGIPGGTGGGGGLSAGTAGGISNPTPRISSTSETSIVIAEGAIQITPRAGQSAGDIASEVQTALIEIWDKGGASHQQHGS